MILKKIAVGLLVGSLFLFSGCQSDLGLGSETTKVPEQNQEQVVDNAEAIFQIIKEGKLQYPAQNEHFYYNVYDNYVMITKYLGDGSETVVIPDTIENLPVYVIESSAFYKAPIQKIEISKNVIKIGEDAFAKCEQLTSVTFVDVGELPKDVLKGNGVVYIEESAFEQCILLSEIILPDSLVKIGENAFERCESLPNITFPESLTSIGGYAFAECLSFTEISFPSKITCISSGLCYGCKNLVKVYVGDTVTEISSSAFSEISTEAVFYGKPHSAAAIYAAERFYSFVILEEEEEGKEAETTETAETTIPEETSEETTEVELKNN